MTMSEPPHDDANKIEAAIKDLDLDYMRGLVSEDDYKTKIADLRNKLELAGGEPTGLAAARATLKPAPEAPTMLAGKETMTDPVTAVRKTVQDMRRLPIERIAQDSGVSAVNVTRILRDLLDGRELSGRIDHDSGDFMLGTGTGPAPKTIASCPYCRTEMKRIAVKGETITCSICNESFIVS